VAVAHGASSRRALQRRFEKYVLNPGMRFAIRRGWAPRIFALIETTGRRTGLQRETPVTVAVDGAVVWLVSEHGWRSGYVQNIQADPRVRVKLGKQWRTGRAALLPEDDARGRRKQMDQINGWLSRVDRVFFDMLSSQPLTVRIDLDANSIGS
jgi:deazaflavin-dependent oxidoreductase (nitroreductase family)